MGTIDKAVPFFGQGFNKIYPLIMVVYTLLVASNFFDRIISFFGNWKIFRFQTETDDMDGFDPSGLLILQKGKLVTGIFFVLWFFSWNAKLVVHRAAGTGLLNCFNVFNHLDQFEPSMLSIMMHLSSIFAERSWLEQGRKLGEHVLPLARNFNGVTVDLESEGNAIVCDSSLNCIWISSSSEICIQKFPIRESRKGSKMTFPCLHKLNGKEGFRKK